MHDWTICGRFFCRYCWMFWYWLANVLKRCHPQEVACGALLPLRSPTLFLQSVIWLFLIQKRRPTKDDRRFGWTWTWMEGLFIRLERVGEKDSLQGRSNLKRRRVHYYYSAPNVLTSCYSTRITSNRGEWLLSPQSNYLLDEWSTGRNLVCFVV